MVSKSNPQREREILLVYETLHSLAHASMPTTVAGSKSRRFWREMNVGCVEPSRLTLMLQRPDIPELHRAVRLAEAIRAPFGLNATLTTALV